MSQQEMLTVLLNSECQQTFGHVTDVKLPETVLNKLCEISFKTK